MNNFTAASPSASRRFVDLDFERKKIHDDLDGLQDTDDSYAAQFVKSLFEFAGRVRTTDMHLQPTETGLSISFRNDGVLQPLGLFPVGSNSSVISRLKVLSNLQTFVTELPQEGRIQEAGDLEIRVCTLPTMNGERVVLRFFGHNGNYRTIDSLGHRDTVVHQLKKALHDTAGGLLVTGPAGTGKTTTLYAALRYLLEESAGGRSIVTIEDPIEMAIGGIAQSKVNLAAGFDLKTGLRAILRQDPEVIMIGEIRDSEIARIAIQASLTGQLVLSSFHSDSAATAIRRLYEMGIESYAIRSGLNAVLSQRLVRVLCGCNTESHDPADRWGLDVERVRIPQGCGRCNETGYRGRVIISEFLSIRGTEFASQMRENMSGRELHQLACDQGMVALSAQARQLVNEGITSPAEVCRVLGSIDRLH